MNPRRRQQRSLVRRWIARMIGRFVGRLQALLRARRASRPRWRPPIERADEKTMRHVAEAQRGGLSSRESAARYERGENPGGLHHRAVRREGPEHERPSLEEPQERKEKVLGGPRRIPVMRRGS